MTIIGSHFVGSLICFDNNAVHVEIKSNVFILQSAFISHMSGPGRSMTNLNLVYVIVRGENFTYQDGTENLKSNLLVKSKSHFLKAH